MPATRPSPGSSSIQPDKRRSQQATGLFSRSANPAGRRPRRGCARSFDTEASSPPVAKPLFNQPSALPASSAALWRARAEWREAILAAGLPVILDGQNASYEDDPGWIKAALGDAVAWGASLIQLDLLSDIADPRRLLQETAPQDPDELLQADEIAGLTESYPLLIAMNVLPDQARALRSAFPAARGVFLRLTSPEIRSALRFVAALAG